MTDRADPPAGALLCFDGSSDAAHAITVAGALLGSRAATVVTVWEPVAVWAPYDPAALMSAGVSRLASEDLGLDEIAEDIARETLARGVRLAGEVGFQASGKLASGKAWRAICEAAKEIDASSIVVGARGLSRVQSALLGSVSGAVVNHAGRPVLVVPVAGDPS
jgi:nucleotide-binding universal stress UspA family protein